MGAGEGAAGGPVAMHAGMQGLQGFVEGLLRPHHLPRRG